MTIQTFPSTPIPAYSIIFEEGFETTVSEFQGENEQRLMGVRFPLRTVTLPYVRKTPTGDWATLHDFFRDRFGGYESFYFVDLEEANWKDEKVGRGTAGAGPFDLPSISTTVASLAVYVGGVLQVKDTDFTFISGGGGASSDRIQFITGHYPATGVLITANFTGKLRLICCLDDRWRHDWNHHNRRNFEIHLRQTRS